MFWNRTKLWAWTRPTKDSLSLRIRKLLWSGLYPITGFVALVWFLIRVVPKPSRAAYPCQRAAFPIASGFVIYLTGLITAAFAFRRANVRFKQARYWLAAVCFMAGFTAVFFTLSHRSEKAVAGSFVPADPSNTPIGQAKGLFPGRVVWVHDPNATSWDGISNYWWDNKHSDPAVIESMLENAVCWLTQKPNVKDAWDAIFRYYNNTHGKGNVGYSTGQKIVIKPNHNNQESHNNKNGVPDTPPAVYVALLKQLVYKAGIDPSCIIISDSSRYIDQKTYGACVALFPQVRYEETNYFMPQNSPGTLGRYKAQAAPDKIIWSSVNPNTDQPISSYPVAQSFVDASYVINLARMQGHGFAGVTLCAKNWYGVFCQSPEADSLAHSGNVLHDLLASPQYNRYNPLVDMMGHSCLGEKTILYVLDGLWGFKINWTGSPQKFGYEPFNGDYPSSLLVSQDPVAIDSVALDFLSAQFDLKSMPIDGYLHEAALADNPPSSTFYDPEGDGTRLPSLGVHEHWNNPVDKKYSRNLGKGDGIELVYVSPQKGNFILHGDFNGDGVVNYADLKLLLNRWLTLHEDENWDSFYDIAPVDRDGKIDILDFMLLSRSWTPSPCGMYLVADFNDNCLVGIEDMKMMAMVWLSDPNQPGWNSRCDIAPAGGDEKIDFQDFAVLALEWMKGKLVCEYYLRSDFNKDCLINIGDLSIFASAWLSEQGLPHWDARCDIHPATGDRKIDYQDFLELSLQWLNN